MKPEKILERMAKQALVSPGCQAFPPVGSGRNIFALAAASSGSVSWFVYDDDRRHHEVSGAEALEFMRREIVRYWYQFS